MPFCTYCGQSFTRDEHLERHILTHTNVKPYKCEICHMAFARRDLLSRHGAVHGKDSNDNPLTASGMAPKPAGRTPIACTNCAKTKTKCDKKFPCSRCEARKLTCTMRPTRRVSKSNARILEENNGLLPSPEESPSETPIQSIEPSPPTFKTPRTPLKIHPAPSSTDLSSPLPQTPHNIISPRKETFEPFMPEAAYECHEELVKNGMMKDSENPILSSPQDMIDWSQMQMGGWTDPFAQEHGLSSPPLMPYNANIMAYGEYDDSINYGSNFMPLAYNETPLSSPEMDANFQFPNIATTGADYFEPFCHSRHSSSATSITSPGTPTSMNSITAELEAITIAQDSWSGFKCTPHVPSSSCPKTAKLNLERLEQSLKDHEGWATWSPPWDDSDFSVGDFLTVMPLKDFVRDKLLAVTQTFIHKAIETHKEDLSGSPLGTPEERAAPNFLILPPARVLEYFLRSYSNGFERFFPMTSHATLDVNKLMQGGNSKASSLLTLLMVAQGAMTTPSTDARWLTGGLTETCRISLFDLVEKNIMMAGDSTVLQAALLFVAQAAWSGDKWQMDIGRGQRGIYSAMVRHSGKLAQCGPLQFTPDADVETLWKEWTAQESQSRLVHSWAMVDQDLSLFYDESPLFSVTEFSIPMPDSDSLWRANSAAEWSQKFTHTPQMSFRDLFHHFLNNDLLSQGIEITPLHLRLLLHPLQAMVYQLRQLLSCFSDQAGAQPNTTAASTKARLQEVQSLLQRWYDLADIYMKKNPMCPMMQATLSIFHLISLNAVTNFPEIERLARGEGLDGSIQQMMWFQQKCVAESEEAVFHAGQVLRHIRSMPRGIRPPWWAAAVYRAALVLWANSLSHIETMTQLSGGFPNLANSFAVDALPPDHRLISRYLSKHEGVPVLTKQDGGLVGIDNPFGVLIHCMDVINEGVSTRFADGIRSKLGRLAKASAQ